MVSAKATTDLKVPPDEVWHLIGGFGSLPDWIPDIAYSNLSEGGRVRHLTDHDGQTIVERLEKYDAAARTYSYSILQGPFPVAGYLATLSVTSANSGKESHVEWSATFTPVGASDQEAQAMFEAIFCGGMNALKAKYGM